MRKVISCEKNFSLQFLNFLIHCVCVWVGGPMCQKNILLSDGQMAGRCGKQDYQHKDKFSSLKETNSNQLQKLVRILCHTYQINQPKSFYLFPYFCNLESPTVPLYQFCSYQRGNTFMVGILLTTFDDYIICRILLSKVVPKKSYSRVNLKDYMLR